MEQIIAFGRGKYFRYKKGLSDKYKISLIMDNSINVGEKAYASDISVPVINPQDLQNCDERIFLMSMYFVGMWKQLMELGVDPVRLVYPYMEKPYFQSDAVVDELVEYIRFEKEYIEVKEKQGNVSRVRDNNEWNALLRDLYKKKYPLVNGIAEMPISPISEQFATERGTPVDRVYIERFLNENSGYIHGEVLEIEDSAYTDKFGKDRVTKSYVMDVDSTDPKIDFTANLESGEGIKDNLVDCFILTQTLMYIFDLKAVAHNIQRLLKDNGVALITCSGISQNSRRCMDNYGAYYGFNKAIFNRMFEDEKNMSVLSVGTYGNVKTVTAHLNGLCAEDLQSTDYDENDVYYPLIVYAVEKC